MLKPRFGKSPLEDRKGFRDALVGWFAKHGKDYPWRRTREPYEVLVSEVMLQQTQIATVLGKGYFTRFLESFPDVRTLAVADDASLLKAWEGLGYYRRVRMLRETARAVIAHHGGCFPHDAGELMQLPGIGRYTVGALRAFAFGLPAVLVDGNVARVIARLMDCQDPVDETAGQKLIWDRAGVLADDKRPRAYHAALMELGQTICRPTNPDCINCPVSVFCKTKNPGMLPVKRRKTIITGLDEHAVWLRDPQGRLLLHHESGKRRTGLWKLPLRESGEVSHLPMIAEHLYSITRFRVTLRVYDAAALRKPFILAPGDTWIDLHEVESLAMAAPFRKVTRQLLQDF